LSKTFHEWQQARLEISTSQNNGGGPQILNVDGNEPVDTVGGNNSICINGSPTIQRDKSVNLQATVNSPSANQHNCTHTHNIPSQANNINVDNNASTNIQQLKLPCVVSSEILPSLRNDTRICVEISTLDSSTLDNSALCQSTEIVNNFQVFDKKTRALITDMMNKAINKLKPQID
jgi:hypothetical protein